MFWFPYFRIWYAYTSIFYGHLAIKDTFLIPGRNYLDAFIFFEFIKGGILITDANLNGRYKLDKNHDFFGLTLCCLNLGNFDGNSASADN